MTISVTTQSNVTTLETLQIGPNSTAQVSHSDMNTSLQGLTTGTTPPATLICEFAAAATTGGLTINLCSMTNSLGLTVVGTGYRVQIVKFQTPATNTGTVQIAPGGSNPYNLFGATSKVILNPGEELLWTTAVGTALPLIANGSAQNLTATASATTQTLNCMFILG